MTKDDFLIVMEANADYYPEYDALPMAKKLRIAQLNIDTGTAESFYIEGELVAVGGIRYVGLGEAWMISFPTIRSDRKKTLFAETKQTLIQTQADQKLWRIFASSRISEHFLEHLGFEKESLLTLTRLNHAAI